MTQHNLQNWKGDISYQASRYVEVHSVAQIIDIVKDTHSYPSPVRVKGSHHSTTHCIVNQQGTVIDVSKMDQVLSIDREAMTIRMQAGVLHIDAAKVLEKMGLQFYVNIELGNMTVGSGACCATKDASYFSEQGREFGQVNSYCIAMQWVDPTGKLVVADASTPELLEMARSSYGLFGVVTEVTYKIKPITPLAVKHARYSVEEFAQRLPSLLQQDRSMMLYLFPFLRTVVVEYRFDGNRPMKSDAWQWRLRNWVWKTGSPSVGKILNRLVSNNQWRSRMLNLYNRFSVWVMITVLRGCNTSPADQIIRYPERAGFASYTFSIWSFPLSQYGEVLAAYCDFCEDWFEQYGYRCDLLNVGYVIEQDTRSVFSYTREGLSITIDPVSTGAAGWSEFLEAYNAFCSERGGKPLLNQTPGITASQVQKAFSQEIEAFEDTRALQDPDGRFQSAFFKDLFQKT